MSTNMSTYLHNKAMKEIIIIGHLLLICISTAVAQVNINQYNGDWYHNYNGVCAPQDYTTSVSRGTGKDVYRIETVDGYTNVRVKKQYPCENEYYYWECTVTQCDENALKWHSEINRYEHEGIITVIEYYCTLVYNHGVLEASTYCIQKEFNKQGKELYNHRYGIESFTLYKNASDW